MNKINLNLNTFYDFFNNLMNCLPIFNIEEKLIEYTPKETEEDDILCAICMERKNDCILDCYVSS
jgi:hypothetical protein